MEPFVILYYCCLFVLAVLWFFLPFAIFGTKAKLDALINESRKINAELAAIRSDMAKERESKNHVQP